MAVTRKCCARHGAAEFRPFTPRVGRSTPRWRCSETAGRCWLCARSCWGTGDASTSCAHAPRVHGLGHRRRRPPSPGRDGPLARAQGRRGRRAECGLTQAAIQLVRSWPHLVSGARLRPTKPSLRAPAEPLADAAADEALMRHQPANGEPQEEPHLMRAFSRQAGGSCAEDRSGRGRPVPRALRNKQRVPLMASVPGRPCQSEIRQR